MDETRNENSKSMSNQSKDNIIISIHQKQVVSFRDVTSYAFKICPRSVIYSILPAFLSASCSVDEDGRVAKSSYLSHEEEEGLVQSTRRNLLKGGGRSEE
jgi:hypothetical protein